jgi:hypothetical protein
VWLCVVPLFNPYEQASAALLKSAYDQGIKASLHSAGEWNTYEVVCRKSKISVWTNGVESCIADNCQIPKGRSAWSPRGTASNSGTFD